MDFLWDKITQWLKEMLVSGVICNLTGMFDAILMTTNIGMPNPVNHYGQTQRADCACPNAIFIGGFH